MYLIIFVLLLAYLIGSFPTAYLIGRHYGIILRQAGDGNLGGLNTYRMLGWKPALIVGLIDISKGILAAWLANSFSTNEFIPYLAALLSALGHDFSIYAHFQGGQGMASIIGSLLYLHFTETLLGIGLFVLCFLLFHNWDASWVVGMLTIIVSVWYRGYSLWIVALICIIILTIGIKKWIDLPLARRLRERNP